jgi:signal transduction histidine kinase/PAS domain-containing protein
MNHLSDVIETRKSAGQSFALWRWIWAAVVLSITVCLLISWLYYQQRRALGQSIALIESLRQARIDLTEGFLWATLADDQTMPFDRQQGLALLTQSIQSFDSSAALLDQHDASVVRFRQQVEAFRTQLAAWRTPATSATLANVNIAFDQLERAAEQLDEQLRASLRRQSERADLIFLWVLGISVVLLLAICATVLLLARAARRAERAMVLSAKRLRVLADASRAFAEAGDDAQVVLEQVARTAAEQLNAICIVRLLSGDGQWLDTVALYHSDATMMEIVREHVTSFRIHIDDAAPPAIALRKGSALFVPAFEPGKLETVTHAEIQAFWARFHVHSLLNALLRVHGNAIGTLALLRTSSEPLPFGEDDLRMAQDLADRAALAISNARLLMQLQAELIERTRAEAAAREREQKLSTVLDLLPVGVSILDDQQTMLYTNPALRSMLDLSTAELSAHGHQNRARLNGAGEMPIAHYFPDTHGFTDQGLLQNAETGIVQDDRSIVWANVSVVPVEFHDWRTVLVASDITRLKRVEHELQRSNTHLQFLVDASRNFAETNADEWATLEQIAQMLGQQLSAACVVRLLSDDEQWFDVAAMYAANPEVQEYWRHHMPRLSALDNGSAALAPVASSGQQLLDPAGMRSVCPELWPALERFQAHSAMIVPLRVGGRMIGTLLLARLSDCLQPFTDDDLRLAQDLAGRAALAISNARLYTALQHSHDVLEQRVQKRTAELRAALDRMAALYAITNDAIASNDLVAALQRALDRVAATIKANRVIMLLFDWNTHSIEQFLYSGVGYEHICQDVTFKELMDGLSGWAIRERKPAISPKGHPDPRESAVSLQRRIETECGSIVVVPLMDLNTTFGTITAINLPDEPDFSAADIDLMIAVAGQLSLTYARTRLTARLQQANSQLEQEVVERTELARLLEQQAIHATGLLVVSQALEEAHLDAAAIVSAVAQSLAEVLAETCIINILGPDAEWIEATYISHSSPETASLFRNNGSLVARRVRNGWIRQVVGTGRPLLIHNPLAGEVWNELVPEMIFTLASAAFVSVLVVPLPIHTRIVGTISLLRAGTGVAHSIDEQTFLQDVAERAGLAIENARLFAAAEQARAEAERANRAKSEFLTTMSHELRTPLNAILGFTGTMLMQLPGPLTADQEVQLKTVQRNGKHLLALINDLLDLAKIESGKLELHLEILVVQDVVAQVWQSLLPLAEQKGLSCELDIASEPIRFLSDARALGQILINLLSNAIKFTDLGGVRMQVELQRGAGGNEETLMIRVADTGIGIKFEDQARLFSEFGRINSPEVRAREGTGLGLHLVQRLVGLLNGAVSLESSYGQGSVFTLVFQQPASLRRLR